MADRQPTPAEIFAAIPPPSGGQTARPLAVPAEYAAPGNGPRYYESHIFAPAALAPERIADLQSRMSAAGLIGKNAKYRIGVWDETSRQAYQQVLETANVYGVEWQQALNLIGQAKETQPLPQAVRLTNPADIQATVRTAARALYGHKADEGLVQRLTATFHEQERRAQTQTTGTVVDQPNLSSFVDQQLESAAPMDVALNRGLDLGDTFLKAFMSGGT